LKLLPSSEAPSHVRLFVLGSPVAQGRPRFARIGNFVRTYDPKESRSWKETVKWQAISRDSRIIEGPLSLILHFKLSRPKSLPKKIKYHTKKPDLDNLIKGVKDGLKGICYKDDSQVVRLAATKSYAGPGEQIGVEIIITQID